MRKSQTGTVRMGALAGSVIQWERKVLHSLSLLYSEPLGRLWLLLLGWIIGLNLGLIISSVLN